MPRKSKKSQEKKPEAGLQRIDTLFRKQKEGNGAAFKSKLDNSMIVLSDDDDDFVINKSQCSSTNSGTSVKTEPDSGTGHNLLPSLLSGNIAVPSNGSRTPPTLPIPDPKKLKPQENSSNKTDDVTGSGSCSDSSVTPTVHQSRLRIPATPRKPPPQRNAFSTGQKKRWENSPFRKFTIRKTKSAPKLRQWSEPPDPYYLANFKYIVFSIFHDHFYDYLLNQNDRKQFTIFKNLTRDAKMLYIRLFQRKMRWLQSSTIKYDNINEDLLPILEELTTMKFLQNQQDLNDLREVLTLLPAPDLKDLAKKYHVNSASQLSKEETVDVLVNLSTRKTLGAMFGSKLDIGRKMCDRAKSILGPCHRLLPEPRDLFLRCISLFSLTSTSFEEEESQAQNQIYTLLLINRGDFEYPSYTEKRETRIYRDRAALVEFQEALSMEGDIIALMEKKDFDKSLELYQKAEEKYGQYLLAEEQAEYERRLPSFLQAFTAGAVYVRLLNHGVEILQKLQRYGEANALLQRLLAQEFCRKYRGLWYDRLALNLESHLKAHAKALDVIGQGLADDEVKVGRRLALFQRAERICKSRSHKMLKARLSEFSHPAIAKIPSITIEAQKMTSTAGKTSKSSFIRRSKSNADDSGRGDVQLCSVEEVALAHYRELGYNRGLHGEGSTLMTLMMLYMWDLVFTSLPDVFYNHYQTAPLDLYTDDFYQNRREGVDELLLWLHNATKEELTEELKRSWNAHRDIVCFGLYWKRFSSLDDAQSLVRCLGGQFLSLVFRRHVTDMRHCRSGVPDLMVWSTSDEKFKIVEVKGPGDRLSTKQILWLDYYLSLGAEAEVCHVRGIGAKMLKKTKTQPTTDD